jgi:hypothetical protein
MDLAEYTQQLAHAWMVSYAALVNTLKVGGELNEAALIDRLTEYSSLMFEKNPGAAQFLGALAASVSGDSAKATAILRTLH